SANRYLKLIKYGNRTSHLIQPELSQMDWLFEVVFDYGVDLYFNQSGNGWSEARKLDIFPGVDDSSSVTVADLRGDGTACLVWLSLLHGAALFISTSWAGSLG